MLGADIFFLLMGAILVFAMHAGFAFLEVGTVRRKNQVNGLTKVIVDFAASTFAYFFIGYTIAYGTSFFETAAALNEKQGLELVRFFFLATFAAALPAIISGGIAERARFMPQVLAAFMIVAFIYPFFEGIVWNNNFGLQIYLEGKLGSPFRDFAGSFVVHGLGGIIALTAVILLGARTGRYDKQGRVKVFPPSSIPWLALGSWLLCIGWFGFNVMTAGSLEALSGLVAMNSLLAMAGGIIGGLIFGKNDAGFVHNGALAGLVAVCAGSDIMHPLGAAFTGFAAGGIFVYLFIACQNRWRIDDVLGVFALHGACGVWGVLACGIFGQVALGGLGGVSFLSQLIGAVCGIIYALSAGWLLYFVLKNTMGIRLSEEEEFIGADISIHKIAANPEDEFGIR